MNQVFDRDKHKNSIAEVLRGTVAALSSLAGDSATFEGMQLLTHVLGIPAERLIMRGMELFPEKYRAPLEAALNRRLQGEPLQYILGEWEFMGLPFLVSRGALIPRQDTETLCEAAIAFIRERGYRTALDLCCGSGCIGISLAKLSGAQVTLADISEDAISLARKNTARNAVDAAILQSDLFEHIEGRFDVICCNPPYLTAKEMESLQREVAHEPAIALDGGTDGLRFYRSIREGYHRHLNPGGVLLLEVGFAQARAVIELFGKGYAIRDLCGVKRVVVIWEND